jgi:hypothetical protein
VLALRESVLHFAPYGFRATWHHLVVSAALPVRLEDDPGSLLRAVDELEAARRLWLAEAQTFKARRRQEKAAGRRQPRRDEGWHVSPARLAFCPDPEVHPPGTARDRGRPLDRRLPFRRRVFDIVPGLRCSAPVPAVPELRGVPMESGGRRRIRGIRHRVSMATDLASRRPLVIVAGSAGPVLRR